MTFEQASRFISAEERIDHLERALGSYGEHDASCKAHNRACTCGFTEMLIGCGLPATTTTINEHFAFKDKARIDKLESLLRELIDIEGPQPGHVMWARKVATALGITSETAVEPEKCTCGHTLGHHNGGNGACTYSDPVGHCECRGFVVNRGVKP